MMLEAAPTPCSRSGFHMIRISTWLELVWVVVAVVHATGVVGAVGVAQVGSIMSKSPGLAASIALWMLAEARTWTGALPPIVTVTVSIDCLAFDGWPAAAVLAVVMTSSPQRAVDPPYCTCCCTAHSGTAVACTVPVIVVSLQLTPWSGMPPTVTFGHAALALLPLQPAPFGAAPKP